MTAIPWPCSRMVGDVMPPWYHPFQHKHYVNLPSSFHGNSWCLYQWWRLGLILHGQTTLNNKLYLLLYLPNLMRAFLDNVATRANTLLACHCAWSYKPFSSALGNREVANNTVSTFGVLALRTINLNTTGEWRIRRKRRIRLCLLYDKMSVFGGTKE